MGTGQTYNVGWKDYFYANHDWQWELTFIIIPRRTEAGNIVWFEKVYRGMLQVNGPGTPVFLYRYMTPEEFTWYQLTQS